MNCFLGLDIGLTGGIGSGKSAAAAAFTRLSEMQDGLRTADAAALTLRAEAARLKEREAHRERQFNDLWRTVPGGAHVRTRVADGGCVFSGESVRAASSAAGSMG